MLVYSLRNITHCLGSVTLLLWSTTAGAEWTLNLTEGVTPISREVYSLHMLILYIVTAIGVIVFGLMAWSIFHHRKSKGAVAANFHHNTVAELIWTAIPILILVAIAVPATKTLIYMEQTGDAELTLKVTGYQWKWKYDYLEEDLSFFSSLSQASNEARQINSGIDPASVEHYLLDVDNPIVLPIKTKIRILTTANDVNHAFWIPALGWKRDAIVGFVNDNWTYIEEPGTYRGQCAELCGRDHAFMPIVLHAVTQEEYRTWVATTKQAQAEALASSDRTWAMEELMTHGETVYGANCAACHLPDGKGTGPFPPLDGSAIVKGAADAHIKLVLDGKNLMPAFAEQLSDADIAAATTYERNAWGNQVGDMVQPGDVKALR